VTSISTPEPFVVHFPDDGIDYLRQRLGDTRWPAAQVDEPWEAGTDDGALRGLVTAWAEFDVAGCGEALNRFAHVRVDIDGELVHAVHERGRGPRPLPIILTHGWPSSFWEYAELIPLLTDPASHGGDPADSFDVIAPSLPGYGFSAAPSTPGFIPADIADRWARLVEIFGYDRVGAHGSDIGAGVSARLARQHPDRVIGLHLSAIALPTANPPTDAAELRYAEAMAAWRDEGGAYAHVQSTRPRTLGYGLMDSPVGLAAWLLEKYRAWSDGRTDELAGLPLEWMLSTLTIYWMTGTITSSFQPYYAARRSTPILEEDRVEVPTAFALFPNERTRIPSPPRPLAQRLFNVTRWNEFTAGGHFPAVEQAPVLARDLREFFRPLR